MVLLTRFHMFDRLNWVMILLIMMKAILTLQIYESQRTLIKMVVQCIIGMIPFLTLLLLIVFTFAIVNFTLDRRDNDDPNIIVNLLTQYRILFGENTEFDITYN